MELQTIEMEPGEAKEAERAYRKAVRQRRNDEDAMLATAYRQLARGQRLIKLPEVMKAAGYLELDVPERFRSTTYRGDTRIEHTTCRVPRLGIARADSSHVWTRGIDEDGFCRFQGKRTVAPHNGRDVVTVPDDTFPRDPRPRTQEGYDREFYGPGTTGSINAMVPIVPPPLRPANALGNYHVLFEADWHFDPAPPPVDPALLKHIGGELYAVLAVWDLTEIERAVLSGRKPE